MWKRSTPILLSLLAVILGAGIVYAAVSYRVTNGTAQQITEWSTCGNITNNSGHDLFVPTNTSSEWSTFRANLPSGVTNGSCCSGNYGNSCTSPANSCGQTTSGTYVCAGTCSVTSAPGYSGSNSLYGQSCTSAANACGKTQSGTYACGNTCGASAPALVIPAPTSETMNWTDSGCSGVGCGHVFQFTFNNQYVTTAQCTQNQPDVEYQVTGCTAYATGQTIDNTNGYVDIGPANGYGGSSCCGGVLTVIDRTGPINGQYSSNVSHSYQLGSFNGYNGCNVGYPIN